MKQGVMSVLRQVRHSMSRLGLSQEARHLSGLSNVFEVLLATNLFMCITPVMVWFLHLNHAESISSKRQRRLSRKRHVGDISCGSGSVKVCFSCVQCVALLTAIL